MALNFASLDARGLRDPSKCARLLGELSDLSVDVTAVQETYFTCVADCQVPEVNYVVFSVSGSCSNTGVSLLVGRCLNADENLVLAVDGGQLVVADVAVKSFEFWVVAVYVPNIAAKNVSFFRRLAQFLNDPNRIVLVGNWNAILNPKIDRVGKVWKQPDRFDGPSRLDRQVSSGSPREGDVDVAR